MENKDNHYIIDFYNHYDEDSRLASQHGSGSFSPPCTTSKNTLPLKAAYWKSVLVQAAIPTLWQDRVMPWTP